MRYGHVISIDLEIQFFLMSRYVLFSQNILLMFLLLFLQHWKIRRNKSVLFYCSSQSRAILRNMRSTRKCVCYISLNEAIETHSILLSYIIYFFLVIIQSVTLEIIWGIIMLWIVLLRYYDCLVMLCYPLGMLMLCIVQVCCVWYSWLAGFHALGLV